MGRRVLAFFLGMIFGIICFLGAIAGGLFIAATTLRPVDMWQESEKYLGDLANMSLLEIYQSIRELYKGKLGLQDGKYYTFGDFCQNYNINPNELFGDKQVPEDVLEIPIFELIGGNRNDAMKQIKVSVIPSLINLFTGGEQGEDGSANALFPDSVLTKLSAHNMAELLGESGMSAVFAEVCIAEIAMGMLPIERTEDNALLWALGQSKLGPLLGGMDGNMMLQFQEGGAFEEMGKMPIVEMLGNSSNTLNAFFGNKTLVDMLDDQGNLNPDLILHSVYIGDVVGLQRNIFSDEQLQGYTETELFNDNVTLWKNGDTGEFALKIKDEEGIYYEAKLTCKDDDESHSHTIDCYGFVWYSTTATENTSEDDLVIDDVRYPRATGMYAILADLTIGELTNGDSNALLDKFMDVPLNELLEGQKMSGVFANISHITIGELIDGGIDNLYLGGMLGYELHEVERPEGDAIPLYRNTPQEEGEEPAKYLIKDADGKVAALSSDGKTWYEGKLTCEKEEHTHTADCYGFVWYEECADDSPEHSHENEWTKSDEEETVHFFVPVEGMMAKLSDKQISDLNNMNETIMELTLNDVMGEKVPGVLKTLGDVPIGELNEAVNEMYLGDLLSFRRKPLTENELQDYTAAKDMSGVAIDGILTKPDADGNNLYAKADGETTYEAQLTCISEEHVHGTEYGKAENYTCDKEEHLHDASCFSFVWYKKCPDGETEGHEHTDEWIPEDSEEYYIPATGMMAKLSDEQVGNLANLDQSVKRLTLGDVLGDDVPGMLDSLRDTPIGNMKKALDDLYVGQILEYRRRTVEELDKTTEDYSAHSYDATEKSASVKLDGEGNAIKQDGEVWYEATLTCQDKSTEHMHDASCYGFVWYKKCTESTEDGSHDHDALGEWKVVGEDGTEQYYAVADGMMGKLSNEKLNNLDNLNTTIQSFTLRDVMGEKIPESLKSLADVPISELGTSIDDMYLGAFLKYVKKPIADADSYEEVDGTGGKVKKSGENYVKQDDDGDWYDATLYCLASDGEEPHTHTLDCYRFNWYTLNEDEHDDGSHTEDCYLPIEGIIGKISRLKIKELNGANITNTVNDTLLGEVLNLENANGLLKELATVKIGDLSSELDTIYVGIAMNYKRQEVPLEEIAFPELAATDGNEAHKRHDQIWKDSAGNYYFHDIQHDKYYKAVLTCRLEIHTHGDVEVCGEINENGVGSLCKKQQHTEHTFTCYGFVWYDCTMSEDHEHGSEHTENCKVVNGLNSKVANLRIDELTGGKMTAIAQNLTVSDVMDSGMMNLSDSNISFLSILFDSKGDCSLPDYLWNGNNDPKTYWTNKHGGHTPDEADHGLEWQDMLLSEFISKMLDSITNLNVKFKGGLG